MKLIIGDQDQQQQPMSMEKRDVQLARLHPLSMQNMDGLEMDEQTTNPWMGQHLPYTVVGTLLAAVALAAVLIHLTASPQQPLSEKEAEPATVAGSEPHPRPLVISASTSSIKSNQSSDSVTVALGTQPIRIKAKGLLERRGSNASLTIDLNPVETLRWGTPPKECSAVEYLSSAGNRMTRRQLKMCLKDAKSLHQEFMDIPLNHPGKLDLPGCSNKNRYKSIWPNEASRVRLPLRRAATEHGAGQSVEQTTPTSSSVSPAAANAQDVAAKCSNINNAWATYINANYIRGYDSEPHVYIATQGPLANTIDDFWSMVWNERSPCVVMMTRLKENNRIKCEPYLPAREAQYGDVHVTVRMTTAKNGYYVRDLLLRHDNKLRQIKHFWFTGWPDHKAPSSTAKHLIDLAQEVEAERQRQIKKHRESNHNHVPLTGPVVVHCSAGLGRTGCFVATSIGMRQLQEENMVDVLGTVCQMRLDRGGMIQTMEQYEFVHHALIQYERQLPQTPTSATLPLTSSGSHSNSNPSSRSSSKHDSPVF